MKNIKITIISNIFLKHLGGATGIAYGQAAQLKKRGYDVFVFTTTEHNNIGWSEEKGIKIYRVKMKSLRYIFRPYLCLFNFRINKEFKNFLKEVKPDIIHFHNLYYHLPFSLIKIAKKNGSKVFFTAHDVMTLQQGKLMEFINPRDLSVKQNFNYKVNFLRQIKRFKKGYNPFRNIIIKYYLKYVDKIFAVSRALKDALNQNGIKNVEVIYNGIDIETWKIGLEQIIEFKKEYNIENKKIIFFGGRLSVLKGGEKIILAMQEVVKKIPQAVLLVAGSQNDYVQKILSLAQKLGIKNNIIFIGWLSGNKLKSAYWSSDLITIPSICFDSFPTVILEAMACKKPVIATCFGGSSEIVLDRQTGYIVNPLNTEMMADKITDLLKNPEKAEKFGQAGYQRVKEKFSLNKQTEKILKYYQGALKK